MSNVGDKEAALAKVYAAAIFEVGKATEQGARIAEELQKLAELVEADRDLMLFLESPVVKPDDRKVFLEKLLRGKYSDVLVDSLHVLNRNDRLGILTEVSAAFHALQHESLGRVELHVRSAAPLTDALRERLRERIARATGKKVDLLERIDSSIIGGIVLQLGDRKFDGSVQRKLAILTAALLERSSRELHTKGTYTVGAA